MNKFKWSLIDDANTLVNNILNSVWDATKNSIMAGYEQNITISERGIIVKSPSDPKKWIVIQNGVVGLTNNDGITWETAITPDGVFASTLVGKIILSNRVFIEDEDGIIKISGSKQQIFDSQGNEKVVLGKIDETTYGLKVDSGAIKINGGLTRDNISKSYTDSILYDDSKIRGELRLTSPLPNSITLNVDGITAYTPTTTNFARMDYRGLYVQGGAVDIRTSTQLNRGVTLDGMGLRGYKSNGTESFRIDNNGDAVFSGDLSAAGGTFSGNLSGVGGTFSGTLSAVGGSFSGTLSGSAITGGTISGTTISGNTISGGTISGTTITGGSITSNTTISVTEGVQVGNYINIGEKNSSATKYLYFNNGGFISGYSGDGTTMEIHASNKLILSVSDIQIGSSLRFKPQFGSGTIDFSAVTINWGNNMPVAVFG